MFDGGKFLYASAGTSINLKMANNWHLNNNVPYTCNIGFLDVDFCRKGYDILDGAISFGADGLNW